MKLKVHKPFRLVAAILILASAIAYLLDETSFMFMVLISSLLSFLLLLHESTLKKKK